MRYLVALLVAFPALALLGTPVAAQERPSGYVSAVAVPQAELDAIRAATAKYRDIKAALADGYVLPMDMCITSGMEGLPTQLGAMGLHYVRPDLLGLSGPPNPRVNGTGTHTDFTRPSVLIYEPQADGSQKLVAIENLVWAKAWKEAGNTSPPSFHGNQYFYMIDNPMTPDVDEAHGFEPHYELHFWLYKDNPAGAFSPFNPAVSCAHHKPRQHSNH